MVEIKKPNDQAPVVPTPPTNPMDGLKDITLKCVETDCSNNFVFSPKEQIFYRDMGLATPKRCPACRMKRRMEKEGRLLIMDGNNKQN